MLQFSIELTMKSDRQHRNVFARFLFALLQPSFCARRKFHFFITNDIRRKGRIRSTTANPSLFVMKSNRTNAFCWPVEKRATAHYVGCRAFSSHKFTNLHKEQTPYLGESSRLAVVHSPQGRGKSIKALQRQTSLTNPSFDGY